MKLKFTWGRLWSAALIITLGLTASGSTVEALTKQSERKVVLTFSFFGCNRIDQKDWDKDRAGNPSSANVPQLKQNLTDIAALGPDYLFFGGDLVMGYADDNGEVLKSQMGAWFSLLKTLPRSPKTSYIVMPGNHELNRKPGETRLPNPKTDAIWTDLLKSNGYILRGAKGPTAESDPHDKLVSDQQAMNFSFDRGSVHFVILNTDTRVSTKDPVTGETKIGMVPAHWLNQDLDAAETNSKINCVVVMGHRNLVEPTDAKGDAAIDTECGKPMIASLKAHSKVRAYVCAHVHAYDMTAIENSKIMQVTFGNGGSKLEKGWSPANGRTFGFGYFKVYSDGSLGVIPHFRPEPKPYTTSDAAMVPPAKPLNEFLIHSK